MTSEPLPAHEHDLELVRRALQREREALELVLERAMVVRRVVSAKNVLNGRRMDAAMLEDIVQDAYLTLWKKLPEYRGVGSLEAFAYRIAHFTWLSWLRKQKFRASGGVEPKDISVTEEAFDTLERDEQLLELFGRVSADEERVLRLRHFEYRSFEEIGTVLSEPEAAVKTRYYRCLQRLRELLSNRGDSPDFRA